MGFELYKLRNTIGMTQKQCAELIGVRQSHIAYWENPECKYTTKVKNKISELMKKMEQK